MNLLKKNKLLVIGGVVAFAAIALLLFCLRGVRQPATTYDSTRVATGQEQKPLPPAQDDSPPTIPNLIEGEDVNAPYDAVTVDEFSPTTLREEDVQQDVASTLDGLLRLDPAAIEKVSPRTTGGDHNPFRYMLQTAAENKEIGDAFRRLASASEYEILRCNVADDAPNHYTVYFSCTTPYVAGLIPVLAAGPEPKYVQEISRFSGTGAAAKLAGIDLRTLPISTDVVALTVIVENDVPVIYHPVSLNYGGRKPQYAFLWGGAVFSGTLDGDLLTENTLGHSVEVEREKFLSVKSNALVFEFIESALDSLKRNDIGAITDLALQDTEMGISSFVSGVVPEQADLGADFPEALDKLEDRVMSLEYSFRYFGFKRSTEGYIPYNTLLITYSVVEPDGGGRTYFHQLISWSTLNEMDRAVITNDVSDMLTAITGGERQTLLRRIGLHG